MPDSPWRPHLLSRCGDVAAYEPGRGAAAALATSWELYGYHEGGDAVVALELYVGRTKNPDPLVLVTLGQFYLMAGQGVPELVPAEGPAADTGSWERNRIRFLARAAELLEAAGAARPDDAAVDYLLADVERARGEIEDAEFLVASGMQKCTIPASMDILARYQELLPKAAVQQGGAAPEYPPELADRGVGGEVVQDLLVAPDGKVVQIETVRRADRRLARSAAKAFSQAVFQPARVGKYPIWSWVRVTTRFGSGDDE